MSGRFVSAGTAEDPPDRDQDWLKAQQELEANARRKKEEASGLQEGGKSLYEVLQANKAAKQDAVEESMRLKNQFRSLDEDEVDFLDSVLESTRAKDEAVRKETTAQLSAFRKQQEEAEKASRSESLDQPIVDQEEQWHVSNKKRKKGKDSENRKAFKLRRTSSSAGHVATSPTSSVNRVQDSNIASEKTVSKVKEPHQSLPTLNSPMPLSCETRPRPIEPNNGDVQSQTGQKATPPAAALGLVDYSSDDE